LAIYFSNQNVQEINSKINATGGTIVQVVETRSTANLSCANWATANFLFSGTITPTVSTNKILVYAYIPFRMDAGAGAWSLGYIGVYRGLGTTQLMVSGWDGTWRNTISSWEKQYLDSPESTSTQTYAVYAYNYPSGTCYYNNNGGQQASDGYAYLRMTEISV
jgi:hypothetical protein